MEFKIPIRREDLLSRTFAGQYTVQEVLTVREIERKSQECRTSLKEQGISFITEYFDVFYSCISQHALLSCKLKSNLWNILIDAFELLLSDIKLNLEDESLDNEMKLSLHNVLKMIIYLICNWLPSFEEEDRNVAVVGKKSKGKATSQIIDTSWDWNKEKVNFVQLLNQLREINFNRLWEHNEVEEEFLNLLINCCYKLLESTNLNRLREVKETIFHILAGLLTNQKHLVGHAVKIVQHLQLFDHSAGSLAQAVVIFVKEYKMDKLLNEIIREIANTSAQESSQDASTSRAFATFLAEVAKQIPAVVLPNISYLASQLDGDSYNMRNCVLIIMGEILMQTKVNETSELNERTKMLRDQFMDHLEDHLHDVHAFVRCRCLQIWSQLCENHLLPISRQLKLLDTVIGRLQDKTCSVRKSAIHLVTVILQSNPFAAKISLSELEESLAKEKEKLNQLLQGSDDNEPSNDISSSQENNHAEDDQEAKPDSPDVTKQKLLLNYLQDSIAFAKAVARALPMICQLLSSSQTTDVLEAIQFFKTAYKFGIHNSIIGIQKMLTLVWSKEAEIRDAVTAAYKSLYLNAGQHVGQRGQHEVANNLIRLTNKATIGEMASLEQLIHDMVISDDINKPVIDALWEKFRNQEKYTEFESHAAINLIGMVASVHKDMIENRLDVIATVGFGERAKKDCLFARDVCSALLKLGADKPSLDENFKHYFLPADHILFTRLSDVLISSVSECENYSWIEMAQKAVDVIFKLSEKPDRICEDILRAVFNFALSTSNEHVEDGMESIPSKFLINLMLLSSHIAMKQMLHLEVTVFNALKRRRYLEENCLASNKKNKNRRKSLNARDSLRESMIENGDSGMNTAVAEDADAEYIRKICDNELLFGDHMLSSIAKMTLSIVSSPIKYPNPNLQTAAVLALAKFMTVSEVFCGENMQLLFTILEKSKFPSTRSVIMIALADLSCRFPNTFEPWTAHIFKRVLDESFEVRQNALAVLGHLLMNDMIKVKGCVSDVALCIVDEDDKIQKLAKQIFYDLSQKSNAIFNLLPDIISRLSDAEVGTTEEKFQTIMKYMLVFVKKDRLLESLVEKICLRFTVMTLEWQWRNLAFCLTLICESEKCLRKLLENVASFQDKMIEDDVYNAFSDIIANARKIFKQELQTLIDELEQQIEHHRRRVLGNEDEDHVPYKPSQSTTKRVQKKATRRRAHTRADSNSPESKRRSPLQPENENTRGSRKPKKTIVFDFSSDDDDFDY